MWPNHFPHDYAGAVVRLATIIESRVSYLLFGCLELYPNEVPIPPIVQPEVRTIGTNRLVFSATSMSLADGLLWYQDACGGKVGIPQTKFTSSAIRFGTEPVLGHLVVAKDLPFAPDWHGGPRMSRLVPLDDLQPVVRAISDWTDPSERQKTARAWLAQRFHFDLLAYDEWLGGIVLLAPNPVTRHFRISGSRPQASGSETIHIEAAPRSGFTTTSLSVRFREVRFGSSANADVLRLDDYGRASSTVPQPIQEAYAELHCDQRGLLGIEGPYEFIRSVPINIDLVSRNVSVEVPSPRKGGKSTRYIKESRSTESFTVDDGQQYQDEAAQRIGVLESRRRLKVGEARPDALWSNNHLDEVLFYDDRRAAANFIRGLISRARSEVVFVDPFFDHVGLREFAFATSYSKMQLKLLIGRDHLKNEVEVAADQKRLVGDILFNELAAATIHQKNAILASIDMKVMGGDCRKYHDRFLLVDMDVWHCGHSFNQVGRGEVSMMTRLRQPKDIRDFILADFTKASDYQTTWREIVEQQAREKQSESPQIAIGDAILAPWLTWWEGWLTGWGTLL